MLITSSMLDEANYRVTLQLRDLGFYSGRMARVVTRLVPFGWDAFGWKYRGSRGEIHIPAVSVPRLGQCFGHPRVGLREVLRHEFGHALVDLHPELFRSGDFRKVFGAAISCLDEWLYDPELFISPYAASCPEEDFCETFMVYVGQYRNLRMQSFPPVVRRKLRFVASLRRLMRRGTWS